MTTNPTPIADGEVETLVNGIVRAAADYAQASPGSGMLDGWYAFTAARKALLDHISTRLTSLAEDNAKLRERVEEAVVLLEGVLCDPEGQCCIAGSEGDRAGVDQALALLRARSNLGGSNGE